MEIRPVAHILGLLLIALGVAMLPSAALDLFDPRQSWSVFALAGGLTTAFGAALALATPQTGTGGLSLRQAFLLTASAWVVLPFAGAFPFIMGVPHASLTDACFEAMSGITTTGTTVFVGLDAMPRGTLLWRGMLQWLGGLGIVIVTLIFLPVMRVGGMQFFRSEGFDTMGKVLPRALDISRGLLAVYGGLTALCFLAYAIGGMGTFDAAAHALSTISTGGFSTSDASFAKFSGPLEYVGVVFMVLGSLPFIRFVQLMNGRAGPLFGDIQARAYIRWLAYAVGLVALYRLVGGATEAAPLLRETTFNVVSIFSGTGYGSADVTAWGPFAFTVIFFVGLIGGCTASTGCSIKVFRYLVAFEVIRTEIRQLHQPSGLFRPRLGHQVIPRDVIDSVIVFFSLFILTLGVLIVLLSATGLTSLTALTAAWTAIANIGPAFGPEVGPTGAVDAFPAAAKWLMIFAMLLGRIELLAVYVLFLPVAWEA